MHNDIQEVCETSRLVTALALTYRWSSMALLTSYLMLNTSVWLTSLHSLIFSMSLHGHMIFGNKSVLVLFAICRLRLPLVSKDTRLSTPFCTARDEKLKGGARNETLILVRSLHYRPSKASTCHPSKVLIRYHGYPIQEPCTCTGLYVHVNS